MKSDLAWWSGLWMVQITAVEELKSSMMASGAPFAMITGICRKPELYASRWVAKKQDQPHAELTLEKDLVPSG